MTGVLLVTVTIFAFLEDLSVGGYWRHDRLPEWLILAYSVPLLIIIAIMMLSRSRDFGKQAQGIQRTSYCAIGYTLATVAVFGLVVSKPKQQWEPLVTTNVVYVVAGMTLILPILVLLSLSRALPRRP